MNKVRIGTRTYDDQLSVLSGLQIRDAMDTAGSHRTSSSGTASSAYAPSKPVAIEVKMLGGDVRRLVVRPTDLTSDGMGCLVGMYLYPGLDCIVQLVTNDGEYVTVPGRTDNCVFLGNRAHYLGIHFDPPIEIAMFLPQAVPAPVVEASEMKWIARLIERIDGRLDHPLRDDFVTILRSEAARLSGEEAMLTPAELQTPDRVAVLSFNGNMLAVNPAWLLFALENGYAGGSFQNQNYFRVLEAHREQCAAVRSMLEAVEATIDGVSRECRYAYACHDEQSGTHVYRVRHAAEKRMKRRVIVVTHTPLDGEGLGDPDLDTGGDTDGEGLPIVPAA